MAEILKSWTSWEDFLITELTGAANKWSPTGFKTQIRSFMHSD